MLPAAVSYPELLARFAWDIPPRLNIAEEACARWADGTGRQALVVPRPAGEPDIWSFDRLEAESAKLANVLGGLGATRGDRVAILLPQRPETAVAHLAAYRLGAIAVPLFVLFGPEALEYRLNDCGALVVLTDAAGAAALQPLRSTLPALRHVLCADGPGPRALDWPSLADRAASTHAIADTAADDPAVIIYTSGTTGAPKGALHAHRVLRGHLPGVELPHDFFPRPGDLFWTPADWAWIGGLLDVLLPSLFHGVPVLCHRFTKFEPDAAMALMATHGVRNVFMPATALRLLQAATPPAALNLRTLASGGETLGGALLDWGRAALGLAINEFYGQTECNLVVGNNAALFPPRPGSMGRAIPGHRLAIVDDAGNALAPGEPGEIAVAAPDPVMFVGYWNRPEATAAKFRNGWMLTGDTGTLDEEGHFHFAARADDVITSAGYRIGPGPIEDCLCRHPSVAMAAVVGVPDALRTEIVKAWVVLKPGVAASGALAGELQAWVRDRLAAHEYPRAIAFTESLPTTTTGKIVRRELRARG
jgi:acetyl-CoA synthetase